MELPVELIQLREVLWNYAQDAAQREQAVSTVKAFLGDVAVGLGLAFVVAVVFSIAISFLYQPRLARGAIWTPAFGFFGGTPTLYTHTRPASFSGIFLTSRRRRVISHRHRLAH